MWISPKARSHAAAHGLVAAALAGLLAGAVAGCSDTPTSAVAVGGDDHRPTSLAGAAREYVGIDVPGARLTSPQGIDATGAIVGTYVTPDFVYHGFLLKDGTFTTIDYPGAAGTILRGIGPDGEMVGDYWRPGEPGPADHGFRLTKQGEFVPVDYAGHLNTIAQRILPDGTILGCRHDDDTMGSMKGIVVGRDGATEISAFASMINGATPDRRFLVGLYTNMEAGNRGEGFIIDDGVFTPLVLGLSTAAWDVNARRQIAGLYRDAAGVHGFVLSGSHLETLDYPGATATRAFGINNRGDVVGNYAAGGRTHGFLATRASD